MSLAVALGKDGLEVETAASWSGSARLIGCEVARDVPLNGRLTAGSLSFVPFLSGNARTLTLLSLGLLRLFVTRGSGREDLAVRDHGVVSVRVALVGCEGILVPGVFYVLMLDGESELGVMPVASK